LRILDLGSGPTPKLISNYTEIEVVSADNRFLEIQDMEKLTYADNSFDLVVCINALDHTKDAERAVNEMLRVGLVVYINCAIDQKTRHRKKHYWDAKPDGTFTNGSENFNLKDYGFEVEFEDGRIKCFLS
jgi:SAM-dependent methyltransferase